MRVLRPEGDALKASNGNLWPMTLTAPGQPPLRTEERDTPAKCVRRTAADPEAAAQCWQGIFSEQRFERPPQPTSTTTPVFSPQDTSEGAKDVNDATPGEDGLRARLLRFVSDDPTATKALGDVINRACSQTASKQAKTSVRHSPYQEAQGCRIGPWQRPPHRTPTSRDQTAFQVRGAQDPQASRRWVCTAV